MQVWRKGCELVHLLERKQQVVQADITKTEDRLIIIRNEIEQYQHELADINLQIKILTPAGVLSREDIYYSIRQQGKLLVSQQLVSHKINQLESEKCKLELQLKQHQNTMGQLKKNTLNLLIICSRFVAIFYVAEITLPKMKCRS